MVGYSYLLNSGRIITSYDHPFNEIVDRLVRVAKRTGFPLTTQAIADDDEAPHLGSIRKYIGDHERMNKAVEKQLAREGLLKGAIEMGGKHRTTDQMLKEYYDLWAEIGEAPTVSSVEEATAEGKCASKSSYATHFGGLAKVRELVIEKYGDPTATSEPEPTKEPVEDPETPPVEEPAPEPEPRQPEEPEPLKEEPAESPAPAVEVTLDQSSASIRIIIELRGFTITQNP